MRATSFGRNRKGQPIVLMRLHQGAEMRKRYIAHIPRWRQPLIGYVFTFPLVALSIALTLLMQKMLPHYYFPGAMLLLAIVLVAFIWGVGPALLSVLIGSLALDYLYIPSSEQITLKNGNGLIQILPFFLVGIVIAIISGQREAARRRALFAEQTLQEHAANLEEANQELKEVNQMKDKFISMASHELKTPITTIRGQTQIMLRRLSKQKELPRELATVPVALEKIDEQTRRLNTLVDDLLDLSSIRAGKIELRLSPCDLCEVCSSVIEEQRQLSGRDIELEQPSASVTLNADCERLSQVIINLVSNAIKYSSEKSPIRVSVLQQEKTVQLVVRDYGEGISKDEQKHIFETFYRSPDAQTSKKSGWGLGLAICKDIVERHSGRIWCESHKGEGSTFFVELPAR